MNREDFSKKIKEFDEKLNKPKFNTAPQNLEQKKQEILEFSKKMERAGKISDDLLNTRFTI